MCGVFGVHSHTELAGNFRQFLRGSEIARHRGPDGAGAVWFDTTNAANRGAVFEVDEWTANSRPTTLLCHRRLAIIDLSSDAGQPMATPDGQIWLSYNGELYNFIELREELKQLGVSFSTRSDTEVVLKAYQTWGPDAASRFVGMWGFAVLDLRNRRLMLSRDRFGIKPLHYYSNGDRFAFASEIKQILELEDVPRRVNDRAVYDYLQFEATDTGPETFFADIRKVRPGHNLILSLDDGQISEQPYYTPPIGLADEHITPDQAAERFRALLKDSVRIHLRSDVPVGTCLSGGLDSSSIAMLMREVADDEGLDLKRHAFNCHFDVPEADELAFTKQTIAAAGVIPHFVEPGDRDIAADLRKLVWHQDEPFGSTSIYAQWAVFRLVQETGIKVVLDGQGADEMLGGYASTVPHFMMEQVAKGRALRALWESRQWARAQEVPWHSQIPLPALRRALSVLAGRRRAPSVSQDSWLNPDLQADQGASSSYARNLGIRPNGKDAHFANVLHQFFFLNNLPALLRYEDRNSMAFSVEARVPFLDHRLVDYAFSLPARAKFRDGFTKRVLRDAMKGTLPEPVRMRARKMGFATPEKDWQTGVLRPHVIEAIEDPRLARYIHKEKAHAHYRNVAESGMLSFAPWRWVNLSLWLDEFGISVA